RLRTACTIECSQRSEYELAHMRRPCIRIERWIENVRNFNCRATILGARPHEHKINRFTGRQRYRVGSLINLSFKMSIIVPPEGGVSYERIVNPGIAEMRNPWQLWKLFF